ncbi:MAG: phosphatidylserine decarboxylase, partial [Methylococcus sp.]
GEVTPPTARQIQTWTYPEANIQLGRGAEMGRFNMGSTIIMLFGPDALAWRQSLQPGQIMRMGEQIGQINDRR